MLVELAVRDLGVIEAARLVLGPGMTVLSGETGAGKTLVVDAMELLVGGKADPVLVRAGATEAWVEGRFVFTPDDGIGDGTGDGTEEEVVLARAIPAQGRSRAYVDGRLATIANLVEWGERLVDLHGQHAHQSLLSPAVQRDALDRFAGIDLGPLRQARATVRDVDRQLAELGGDERARARELDLLRFQVQELDAAGVADPDEDRSLDDEETLLAGAAAHREAAALAVAALTDDDGAADGVGRAIAAVAGRPPFADLEARLRSVAADLADVAGAIRDLGEGIFEDPARLDALRARRQLLADLRRKYGDTMADVVAFHAEATERLRSLEDHDRRAAELDQLRARAVADEASAAAVVAAARRAAAPALADAVQAHLGALAMERAVIEVTVEGPDPADGVTVLLAANPGSPPLPLAKVASGGELARAMLALRLVLTAGPPSLVFDEVDAGIGGAAALAVGRSLARLAATQQVFVVTHLPQVAAFADAHVQVSKETGEDHTVAHITELDEAARVVELTRMLSGQPESRTGREHAEELLATASAQREATR
jgi:DNA repair protein RecN (Recombination protein N)